MADISVTVSPSGSNEDVTIAWNVTPIPQAQPLSITAITSPPNGRSYENKAYREIRPYDAVQQNTFLGYSVRPSTFNSEFRYVSSTTFERLRFLQRDDFYSYGTISTDSDFNSWFINPPTIYGRGITANANLEHRFYGLPPTVPSGWSIQGSPNLWGERRITSRGRTQLKWLQNTGNDGVVYISPSDGKFYYAMDEKQRSTLHGLPGTIYANDSTNGSSGDSVSVQYRWVWLTIDRASGESTSNSGAIATASPSFTPSIWRIRGPVAVTNPSVPSNAYGYRLERQFTVNGNPQGWGVSGGWHPLAPAWGKYDIMDPTTGAWLPAALFEIT